MTGSDPSAALPTDQNICLFIGLCKHFFPLDWPLHVNRTAFLLFLRLLLVISIMSRYDRRCYPAASQSLDKFLQKKRKDLDGSCCCCRVICPFLNEPPFIVGRESTEGGPICLNHRPLISGACKLLRVREQHSDFVGRCQQHILRTRIDSKTTRN
jgi:hypothetical protein